MSGPGDNPVMNTGLSAGSVASKLWRVDQLRRYSVRRMKSNQMNASAPAEMNTKNKFAGENFSTVVSNRKSIAILQINPKTADAIQTITRRAVIVCERVSFGGFELARHSNVEQKQRQANDTLRAGVNGIWSSVGLNGWTKKGWKLGESGNEVGRD